MQKQKMNLANMQGRLTRDEMKNIKGGDDNLGCPGVVECPTLEIGADCQGMGAGCVCKETSTGKTCMPK